MHPVCLPDSDVYSTFPPNGLSCSRRRVEGAAVGLYAPRFPSSSLGTDVCPLIVPLARGSQAGAWEPGDEAGSGSATANFGKRFPPGKSLRFAGGRLESVEAPSSFGAESSNATDHLSADSRHRRHL